MAELPSEIQNLLTQRKAAQAEVDQIDKALKAFHTKIGEIIGAKPTPAPSAATWVAPGAAQKHKTRRAKATQNGDRRYGPTDQNVKAAQSRRQAIMRVLSDRALTPGEIRDAGYEPAYPQQLYNDLEKMRGLKLIHRVAAGRWVALAPQSEQVEQV